MKNILLIGVGGTGSNAVDILYSKIKEMGNLTNNQVTAIVFDTDVGSVEKIKDAIPVSMADPASVGTICDRVGREYIREWFPCDDKAVRAQEMFKGASQWRKKSYLAFLNLMNKPQARSAFIGALEDMTKDPSATCEVYVIASIAGGTGSGSFIPIALYARRYLRKQLGKNPVVNAMVALPDIYASAQTEDNRIKIYANAYAILRELNAIYLVARNFNEGNRAALKSAPVKFRIGNPDEPNVGVLFDADDRQFWTPEAAPFTQIFVLDRIPGVKSIAAHDIVLANSLYTLICTDIGVEFDSEASNHEILRSQNNGSNAIYASVSTSQMNFPVETVLDYLAHHKALQACEGEWLILHREVEKKMQEKQQEMLDVGRKYIAKEGEYAEMILTALQNDKEIGNGIVSELVERGTCAYNEEGKPNGTTAENYFEALSEDIEKRIEPIPREVYTLGEDSFRDAKTKEDLLNSCANLIQGFQDYYRIYVDTINRTARSISEAVITFDKDKNVYANNKLSLIDGILKKDGKFIHPVSAMVQLCRLRNLLGEAKADTESEGEWIELKRRGAIGNPPEVRFKVDPSKIEQVRYKESKSAYAMGEKGDGDASDQQEYVQNRFYELVFEEGQGYQDNKKRTNIKADAAFIQADAKFVATRLQNSATNQLKRIVFGRIVKDVDLLIEKYKTFFSRFEKEKENLAEEEKNVLRKDCGLIDSVLNIYSSEEDKKSILKKVFKNAGPEDENDLKTTDDLVGKSVFANIYAAAVASKSDVETDDKDIADYRSLFSTMVDAYRKFIRKSDAFKQIASYNIVEAMAASCEGSEKGLISVFGEYFSKVQSLATPSLKVDCTSDRGDLVVPSQVIVYMMSKETGKYIKKHADEFNIVLPQGQSNEDKLIAACATSFICKYSGYDSARVAIVKDMPDSVLYCTGEIMDITPLRIPKFDELSNENDNIYYRNYVQAIRNFKKYDTDMWNPHIGNNLFQRGYLPYMNAKKEELEDIKMVKALVYGLAEGKIAFEDEKAHSRKGFRYEHNGVHRVIRGDDGNPITMENIVQLVNWLRKQDDIVDSWSTNFDLGIEAQKKELPPISTAAQIAGLESQLTKGRFMGYFHDRLFKDDKKINRRLLEFAYMLKTNEEATRDCDYADRILLTMYEVFLDLIKYRIPSDPATARDMFDRIYEQQLDNVFASLADCETVRSAGGPAECEKLFMQIVGWCESRNTFVLYPNADDPEVLRKKFSLNDEVSSGFPNTKEALKRAKEAAKKSNKNNVENV